MIFKRVLIANRGEIAVRVIRACQELGIETVAIFSDADKEGRHVAIADQSWRLEGQPTRVYLDIDQIVDIAKRAQADAIHPGYGFLSENADFAQAVLNAGIKFIGPKPEVIRRMGSKVESRRAMKEAGVPVVPGTTDPVTTAEEVKVLGTKYGYPIAIKASAGGGGRGLKVVRSEGEVESALSSAQREGQSYFGSGEVYVEKYLDHPRHIEVQILADEHGNVVALGERDCSTQRRHQKLLEETPAPGLSEDLRKRLLDAAKKGVASIGYTSAGTVECMVAKDDFYFLEVNTRVQVEHPITEMVTGIDIVKEQIMVAQGHKLSFTQADVKPRGHAIECRINAEDPYKNFMPSPGTIVEYKEPSMPWVRMDSACYSGYQVLPYYDSMLGKLVVWGRDREEAVARTRLALKELKIVGVPTTIPFHLTLLDDLKFRAGEMFTTYVESDLLKRFMQSKPQTAAPAKNGQTEETPSQTLARGDSRQFEVEVNQRVFKVAVAELGTGQLTKEKKTDKTAARPQAQAINKESGPAKIAGSEVRATMNGLVKQVCVEVGASVQQGQKLLILEAMKMESEVVSNCSGTISKIAVRVGENVNADTLLIEFKD